MPLAANSPSQREFPLLPGPKPQNRNPAERRIRRKIKMKYVSLSLKVAIAALFVVCLFPTLASAQAAFQGNVHFSNQVRWGQATLPAGDYTITISSGHTPSFATIRSLDGKLSVMV